MMTTLTCIAATLLAILTIPLVILLWASESKQQRARRWRRTGSSYRSIAERLGVSQSTARRWCTA
jgi:ABC-type spermidine/putrescine transport system permease subunit II